MDIQKLKKRGIIHNLIKNELKDFIVPNTNLIDIRYFIENKIKNYEKKYGVNIAFPVGLSLNNCAAHYSPFKDCKLLYTKNDILKIDFGMHIDGNIIDSAFSITHNEELKKLNEISIEATKKGIQLAGVEAHLGDIGENIEEIITSYELEIENKIHKVNVCRNLCGHQILPYKIHGNKVVPNIKMNYHNRMNEGEVYAIETFPTTGEGILTENLNENSHYMINYKNNNLKFNDINNIYSSFNFLAWHQEWYKDFCTNEIDILINRNNLNTYPPLYDINNSYISQTEKTIYIGDRVITF